MQVLQAAESLDLPDWMIGAGFLRNKVWDHLHGFIRPQVDTADIDLIYFNPSDTREETDRIYDSELHFKVDVNWSTKNQARMHLKHGDAPYTSSTDALAHWVETATCVAVTLDHGTLKLIAPHGIADLVDLVLRPSPAFKNNVRIFDDRVRQHDWLTTWPKLSVVLE